MPRLSPSAGVLDGVMLVYMQVALGPDVQVDQRMARELFEHVVEEADAGLDVVQAGPVEVDGDVDRRLGGGAGNRGGAHATSHNVRHDACNLDRHPNTATQRE
jgi:hypothetical protein